MELAFTTRLLAAAALAAAICVPAYADDAPTPPAEQSVLPPKYNQIPQDYEEFAAVYNKALAFLRGTGVQSIHKCRPAGADPRNPNHGWCSDYMSWEDPEGQNTATSELQRDDGKHSVMVCLGDNINIRRCYQDDGQVFDQHHDLEIHLWLTFRTIAGAWNERGEPLSDLAPHAPNPPAAANPPAATPSPPVEQRPPAAASVVPPKYNQIPQDYEDFAAAYNKALAFLRGVGTPSIHKCFPAGSDPKDHRGWCQDAMVWTNDTGQHLAAVDVPRDDGTKVINLCFGDEMNTQRCYQDDEAAADQSLNRKINIWVTSRRVAGAWNERGKPLADLTPRGKRETKR